jgi:NAD-dependent dihydropyrimidine dehydrogenase PreA subunit
MIELISDSRCIDCNLCVKVCPTNVFDAVTGDHPVIARQADCQTCFLCEAYCPVDAMFVAPSTDPVGADSPFLDEGFLIETELLGKYRRDLGWRTGDRATAGAERSDLFMQAMSRSGQLRDPVPLDGPVPDAIVLAAR